jgi:hypothetical protein
MLQCLIGDLETFTVPVVPSLPNVTVNAPAASAIAPYQRMMQDTAAAARRTTV